MRRRIVDAQEQARDLRETFMDRGMRRVRRFDWDWPRSLREVGTCLAVMYSSDKWRQPGNYVDYKHVSEGPQLLYTRPGFIVGQDGLPMDIPGPEVEIGGELPDTIAMLAPILGIQCQLYQAEDGDAGYYLPNGDEGIYELAIPRAKLGAVRDPRSGKAYLVVFSDSEGVLCLVTGDELDVLKDGIVG